MTVVGRVTRVERIALRHVGVDIASATEAGPITVRLGPARYVEGRMKIAEGDQIQVTGLRAIIGGREVILAQRVKKGEATLELRDAAGVPLWVGRKAR